MKQYRIYIKTGRRTREPIATIGDKELKHIIRFNYNFKYSARIKFSKNIEEDIKRLKNELLEQGEVLA